MKINWNWPAKPGNGLVPWYTIVWRMAWWLPLMLSLALTVAVLTISHGPSTASDFWKAAVN